LLFSTPPVIIVSVAGENTSNDSPRVRKDSARADIDSEAAIVLLFGLIQGLVNDRSFGNGSFKLIDTFKSLRVICREAVARR